MVSIQYLGGILFLIFLPLMQSFAPSRATQQELLEKKIHPMLSAMASGGGDVNSTTCDNKRNTTIFRPTVSHEDLDEWFMLLNGNKEEQVDKNAPFPKASLKK